MNLKGFRVTNYRSILDSGWVEVDDITTVVGKNESGKTSLLRALHKLKPFKDDPYNLDREWPRGHRGKRSPEAVVVTARFGFTNDQLKHLAALDPSIVGVDEVEVSKTYGGKITSRFLPGDLPEVHDLGAFGTRLSSVLTSPPSGTSPELQAAIGVGRTAGTQILDSGGVAGLSARWNEIHAPVAAAATATNMADAAEVVRLKAALSELAKAGAQPVPKTRAHSLVLEWMPTFIYMDDHKPFTGVAFLDQVKSRKDSQKPSEEDKTILTIMKMAGIDLDLEVSRATLPDKEQRILDMNDASLTLTNLIAKHWTQRKYEVRFEADGYHFITFVKDEFQTALVPLNERSKGFQWFFSFDMTFLHETAGTFKNSVILLDEPGLHLHIDAQRDLLDRMEQYASGNQLLYTTHMPFMIRMTRLDNIRVCTESPEFGSRITPDIFEADDHARFVIQAALGLSMSQSLFVGPFNLVVEGVTDFWMISTVAELFKSAGLPSLNERVVVIPAGGATKAAYVGTTLHWQHLNVIVLLDSDPEGKRVADGLIKQWLLKDRHVLKIGDASGVSGDVSVEDLFPANFYLGYLNDAYAKELNGKPVTSAELAAVRDPQIVRRIDVVLKARGVQPNSEGMSFNKGRVAKRMMEDLSKKKLSDLPAGVFDSFSRLFAKINQTMPGLKT